MGWAVAAGNAAAPGTAVPHDRKRPAVVAPPPRPSTRGLRCPVSTAGLMAGDRIWELRVQRAPAALRPPPGAATRQVRNRGMRANRVRSVGVGRRTSGGSARSGRGCNQNLGAGCGVACERSSVRQASFIAIFILVLFCVAQRLLRGRLCHLPFPNGEIAYDPLPAFARFLPCPWGR